MNKNIALDALAYFCFCALAGTGLPLGICGVLPSDSPPACA
jgi:hypothetical protein